jgi:hypothetical protein
MDTAQKSGPQEEKLSNYRCYFVTTAPTLAPNHQIRLLAGLATVAIGFGWLALLAKGIAWIYSAI